MNENRTTPIYSFPADCWDLTRRVARSIQTIKHPDTLGSNVPEWPVFETGNALQKIRLIHATTSCDDGLTGLSKLIKPDLKKLINRRVWFFKFDFYLT